MSDLIGQNEMMTPIASRSSRWLAFTAIVLGAIVALTGAGHLVAWLSGYMTHRNFNSITMKTNTALCLTLSGLALAILTPARSGMLCRWAGRVLAAAAALIGALTLSENVVGWDLGIDQLLATEPHRGPGRDEPQSHGHAGLDEFCPRRAIASDPQSEEFQAAVDGQRVVAGGLPDRAAGNHRSRVRRSAILRHRPLHRHRLADGCSVVDAGIRPPVGPTHRGSDGPSDGG